CGGTLTGGVYTTGAVTADCAVTATFGPASYRVTPVAGAHGSITPATVQTVGYLAVLTFTANPDPSYKIASATGCGATVTKSKKTITTAPITGDCSLVVTFSK